MRVRCLTYVDVKVSNICMLDIDQFLPVFKLLSVPMCQCCVQCTCVSFSVSVLHSSKWHNIGLKTNSDASFLLTVQEQIFLLCTSGFSHEQSPKRNQKGNLMLHRNGRKRRKNSQCAKSYICPTDVRSTTNTENVSHSMHPSYHLPVLWFSDRNIRAVKAEKTLTTIHEQN
jgi:hypothetical protein